MEEEAVISRIYESGSYQADLMRDYIGSYVDRDGNRVIVLFQQGKIQRIVQKRVKI